MAAISAANNNTSTLTPPTSSHGDDAAWGYARKHDQHYINASNLDDSTTYPPHTNGESTAAPFNHNAMITRKMQSAENLPTNKWDHAVDADSISAPFIHGSKTERSGSVDGLGLYQVSNEQHKRGAAQALEGGTEDDKWIHRDKLAKIESQELQAAGIFIPRARAPSKQRRDRSQSRIRRGTDASEQSRSRSRKNSSAVEQRTHEASAPAWDLRTPEEIAEEQAHAYFAHGGKGSSRIPVAKTSPAPIAVDHEGRRTGDSPDDEPLMYAKTRSRSASGGARDFDPTSPTGTLPFGKRSATDVSPRKNSTSLRKISAPGKTAPVSGRPKTRSGPGKDTASSSGTRPSTRSGELKQPEGDPPWMVNSYKPDPMLPPDQQLLPTVARRLQQEKWEKEGKFGDVYDKDFRPLNDNVYLKPPELEKAPAATDEEQSQSDSWPLKQDARKSPEPPKSPLTRPGSYSTMPKISDKANASPMPSPRTPTAPQLTQVSSLSQQHQPPPDPEPPRVQEKEEEREEKGGCGCCVVM